jgi:hypothetical protein
VEAALVNFLAPFLPYLLQAGAAAGRTAANEFGETAWRHAVALWNAIVAKQPASWDAVDAVARAPDDADAQAALRFQFRQMIANDPRFARELQGLIDAAQRAGVMTGAGDVVIRDVRVDRGGLVVGRDVHGRVGHDYRYYGADTIAGARGVARFFIGLGLLVGLIGFGLFAFGIYDTAGKADPTAGIPPLVAIGFGVAIGGVALYQFGIFLKRD